MNLPFQRSNPSSSLVCTHFRRGGSKKLWVEVPVGADGLVKVECGNPNFAEKKHATRLKAVYVEGPLAISKTLEGPPLDFALILLRSIVAASAVEDVGNYWCLDGSQMKGIRKSKSNADSVAQLSSAAVIWGALCESGMIGTLVDFLMYAGLSSSFFTPLVKIITQSMRFAHLSCATVFSPSQLKKMQIAAKRIRMFFLPVCFELEERNKHLLTTYGFYGTQMQAVYELTSSAEQVIRIDDDDTVCSDVDDGELIVATKTVQSWPAPEIDRGLSIVYTILLQHTTGLSFVIILRKLLYTVTLHRSLMMILSFLKDASIHKQVSKVPCVSPTFIHSGSRGFVGWGQRTTIR